MRLSIVNVSKTFPSVKALDGVSMEFAPGEVHALMGENGAGKSTLLKIVTGLYRPDAGLLKLDGELVHFFSPRDALAAGIGAVHQERNLVPRFSVGENILLEHPPSRRGFIDYGAIYDRARVLLGLLDPGIDVRAEVATLSVAQMQIVEIAKALSLNARVLLLDEPTASITDHEAEALFRVIARLKAEGVAIVFVSHKLDEVLTISDRVTVLRDGRVMASGEAIAEMSRRRLVSLMIGREERIADVAGEAKQGKVALELREIATSYGHTGINLRLHEAEILGLYGLVGAGRSELARSIIGDGRITGGAICVGDRPARIRNPNEALRRHRIGYVSEDRKGEGLVLSHSVVSNIAVTIWRRIATRLWLIPPVVERNAVAPQVQRLAIKSFSLDQTVDTLSGGNQQKVSLAKWLAAKTDILLIDEPTVGIDIKTKVELHELIAQIARDGAAVLLISSDMAEMITLADRILVMHNLAVVGEVVNDRIYENGSEAIMSAIHAAEKNRKHLSPL
jgi:ribose transport system ATP-binding protein